MEIPGTSHKEKKNDQTKPRQITKTTLAASPPAPLPPVSTCCRYMHVEFYVHLEHVLRYMPLEKLAKQKKTNKIVLYQHHPLYHAPVVEMYVELHVHLEHVLR